MHKKFFKGPAKKKTAYKGNVEIRLIFLGPLCYSDPK